MKIPMANQNFGNSLNLFELRLLQTKMHASNINRYLCTPKREIDKAKAERDDYLARKEAD